MPSHAADLARRLARNAEAVCRHYLSNGHREGRYWLVGDVANTTGRSLFVRLSGPDHGKGAAGKWTDAATGEHGDLLDLIALSRGLDRLRDTLEEARAFLALPPDPVPRQDRLPAPRGSPESARRLYAMSKPIAGTLAETYLRGRGIVTTAAGDPLRFHPRCYYRPDEDSPTETWPALIAAVTDLGGRITGAHRTWLDRSGQDKAPIDSPRRAMGHLLGHGVRFGVVDDVMAAGEGIETMLSLRTILPSLADGRGPLRQPPGSPALSTDIAPSLCRPRPRSGRRRRDGQSGTIAPRLPGSRRSACRPASTTSTRISAGWVSKTSGHLCASSSSRRTSCAS